MEAAELLDELVSAEGRNRKAVLCRRCGSRVLQPGTALFSRRQVGGRGGGGLRPARFPGGSGGRSPSRRASVSRAGPRPSRGPGAPEPWSPGALAAGNPAPALPPRLAQPCVGARRAPRDAPLRARAEGRPGPSGPVSAGRLPAAEGAPEAALLWGPRPSNSRSPGALPWDWKPPLPGRIISGG